MEEWWVHDRKRVMDEQEKLHGFFSLLCEYLVIPEADVKACSYSIQYSCSSFL